LCVQVAFGAVGATSRSKATRKQEEETPIYINASSLTLLLLLHNDDDDQTMLQQQQQQRGLTASLYNSTEIRLGAAVNTI
jgi:hypothetical protein